MLYREKVTSTFWQIGDFSSRYGLQRATEKLPSATLDLEQLMLSIFFTKHTGVGDEIVWEFVDHVMRSNIIFGAYCKIMNDRYNRMNSKSTPFMSNKIFIVWWFSWITRFQY